MPRTSRATEKIKRTPGDSQAGSDLRARIIGYFLALHSISAPSWCVRKYSFEAGFDSTGRGPVYWMACVSPDLARPRPRAHPLNLRNRMPSRNVPLALAIAALFSVTPARAGQRSLPKLKTEVAFPNLKLRPPGRPGLSRRRQQPAVRRRAAQGQDPVVPQRQGHERQGDSSSSSPTRSTGATRRACSAWPSTRSTRRTASSSSTTRPTTGETGQRGRSSRGSRSPRTTPARPTRRASSGSGSRPTTRSRTTTAAASRSAPTATSTSRWATAARPTTP